MSLVRGFTDILTPINLLPNCDFARGGGLPNPVTFSSITTSGASNNVIDENHVVGGYNGTFKDVSITRSDGKLIVTATPTSIVNPSVGNVVLIIYFMNIAYKAGRTYTSHVRWSDMSGSVKFVASLATAGSRTELYHSTNLGEGLDTRITRIDSDHTGNAQVASIQFDGNQLNVPGTVTIDWSCLYEGAFCNPPVTLSIDRKPHWQPMFRNYSNRVYNDCYSFTWPSSRNWMKVAYLGATQTSTMYYRLMITKTYHQSYPAINILEIGIHTRSNHIEAYLSAKTTNTTTSWSKYRITYCQHGSLPYFFLEMNNLLNNKDDTCYICFDAGISNIAANLFNNIHSTKYIVENVVAGETTNILTSEITPTLIGS